MLLTVATTQGMIASGDSAAGLFEAGNHRGAAKALLEGLQMEEGRETQSRWFRAA